MAGTDILELPPAGIHTAVGPSLLPSWFLRALCPALSRGTRIFWIDAGNSFDAHGLGREARALGLDPARVLSNVSLARPFNAYQLEAMVRRKLPACWRGEPVVLSDPLAPFFDEDLPDGDARTTLAGVLEGLAGTPAVWLLLAVLRKAPRGREGVLEALKGRSKTVTALTPEGDSWRLRAPKSPG